MAGAMRKMAVYLGLVEDDRYEDDMYYGDEQEAAPANERETSRSSSRDRATSRSRSTDSVRVTETEQPSRRERPSRDWRTDTVAQEPVGSHPAGSRPAPRKSASATATMDRITRVQPRSYNDARRIGEEFRNGTPVIMNLTELDDTDAKRIVDFGAGLVFGLRGSIERITNKVFLLSPANVDVSDEARAQLEQDGVFQR